MSRQRNGALVLDQCIADVDLESAKQDVSPFVPRPQDLNVWFKEYFRHVVQTLFTVT